jgi:uncharacterized membrane protein YphA (DoxX/SURF4 family)
VRAGAAVWVGRVLSALPFLALVPAGAMKVAHVPQVEHDWVHRCNFPLATLTPLGILEIACAVLFVIPRTSLLGAVLLSCYMTAAFTTLLPTGAASAIAPLVLAAIAWAGLLLRDPRIGAFLPLVARRSAR